MGRAPCCDKANVKRGAWSSEEDAKLKAYIQQHGTGGNWIALPHKIGLKRCGKSCRLRWLNYLRPNIKHGGFSQEEDNIISNLYINIGSRWSIIAAQLPGRTDNDIKNYWNTKLKKKLIGKLHLKLEQSRRLPTTHNFNPGTFMDQSLAYRPELAAIIDDISTCTQLDKMLSHHDHDHDHDPSLDMINNFPATTTQFGEGQTSLFRAELNEVIYGNPQIQSGVSSEVFYGFDLVNGTRSASAECGNLGEIDSSFVCLPQLVSDCETNQRGDMIQDSSCLFAFEEY